MKTSNDSNQAPLGFPLNQSHREDLLSAPSEELDHPPIFIFGPNQGAADLINLANPPKRVEKPYAEQIEAGKNTYVYDAHTYHTKVPPDGIALLIQHYSEPGQVVLDPFCGSGMTGVAARETNRKVILSDLSPAAAFISYNHVTPLDAREYLSAVEALVADARALESRLYTTCCRDCGNSVAMLYMVWSYGVLCRACGQEVVVWDVARDEKPSVRESKILKSFDCPHCHEHIVKRGLQRTKRYPVQIGYKCCVRGTKEQTATPTLSDLNRLDWIESQEIPSELWYPTDEFPPGVNTKQAIAAGFTSVDKVYTPRALWMMAYLWNRASRHKDRRVRLKLLFTLTSLYQRVTLFSEFRFWGGSGNTANYNVPFIINEQNVLTTFARKARTISWYFAHTDTELREGDIRVGVQSATNLAQIPDDSIDYAFTDPPFGANINYSEMNFLWESWLRHKTDIVSEAIVNRVQGKKLCHYESLLADAFGEVRRVLKKDGWFTVVFHNSSSDVWQALQGALAQCGFAIVGTQTFDKKHGTFKQFVSDNAVGYDLVLHCQKALATSARLDAHLQSAVEFMRSALTNAESTYLVRYLHVARGSEFDYRKLYAEWLARSVASEQIGVSFEAFRELVDAERASLVP